MNHSRGSLASLLGTRWCCQPLAYRIEGQIGCAEDQPNPFFVHGDGREKVCRGLLILFEAHGRQKKSSDHAREHTRAHMEGRTHSNA